MKVFVLQGVLCDWTCGVIIVSAKDKKEAIEKIKEHEYDLYGDTVSFDNIEEEIEEVTKDYFLAVWGGG